MLLWEIRGRKGLELRRGWVVAWSQAKASDIARRECAELIGEPIEWLPGHGTQVFWRAGSKQSETQH